MNPKAQHIGAGRMNFRTLQVIWKHAPTPDRRTAAMQMGQPRPLRGRRGRPQDASWCPCLS